MPCHAGSPCRPRPGARLRVRRRSPRRAVATFVLTYHVDPERATLRRFGCTGTGEAARRRDTPPTRNGPEPHDRRRSSSSGLGRNRSCLGPAQCGAFGIWPRSRARSSRAARRGDRPPAWAASTACRQWTVHTFANGVRTSGTSAISSMSVVSRDTAWSLATRHSIEESTPTGSGSPPELKWGCFGNGEWSISCAPRAVTRGATRAGRPEEIRRGRTDAERDESRSATGCLCGRHGRRRGNLRGARSLAMKLANESVRTWINADLDRMAESYGDEVLVDG